MKPTSTIVALFLSFIFISTSFAASPEPMLIGKWKGKEGVIIEFVNSGQPNWGRTFKIRLTIICNWIEHGHGEAIKDRI
jgi:hypothetical protein